MRKLKVVLAVVLVAILGSALLIGCTPSKPNDYMSKWNESEKRSFIEVEYIERGREETTYIQTKDAILVKKVKITREIDKKTNKEAKTDTIVPTNAYVIEKKDGKINTYEYELDDKNMGVWTAEQVADTDEEAKTAWAEMNAVFTLKKEQLAKEAETFEADYEKVKNGYYEQKNANADGEKYRFKVISGVLTKELLDKDGKVVGGIKFDLSAKITLANGAKDALTAFLETTDAVIKSIKTKNDVKEYTVTINSKDYTINSKVIGYDKLKDAQVGDTVSVRLKKGLFGSSISDVYELKKA